MINVYKRTSTSSESAELSPRCFCRYSLLPYTSQALSYSTSCLVDSPRLNSVSEPAIARIASTDRNLLFDTKRSLDLFTVPGGHSSIYDEASKKT